MIEDILKTLSEKSKSNEEIKKIVDNYVELSQIESKLKSALENLRLALIERCVSDDVSEKFLADGEVHQLKISRSKKLEVRSCIPDFSDIIKKFYDENKFRDILTNKVSFIATNETAKKINELLSSEDGIEFEVREEWNVDKKSYEKDEESKELLKDFIVSNPTYRITKVK